MNGIEPPALKQPTMTQQPAQQQQITLIIPIYNAYACLPALLASVQNLQPAPEQVLLVEDASSDQRVRPWLQAYLQQHQLHWTLLLHSENQGFVASVNHAMQRASGHCLLLNQDTICEHRLVAKLKRALQAVPDVATITPFSNNAEIVSLPKLCHNNTVPDDVELMAQACVEAGPPQYPELPTAVGFCMLITRAAIRRLGYFDVQRFGHGYGEENDYSCRAAAVGMRNILCDDAYVAHIGNQSFVDLDLQPNEQALQRVLQSWPNYLQQVQQFIASDPLQPRRDVIISNYQQMLADRH